MDWAKVTKIHTPLSAKRYPPLTSMRSTKDNFATGNGELSKVIAEIKTTAPLLLDNKSTVKHATWSNSCSQSCMKCEPSLSIFRNCQGEYCISASRWQVLAVTSSASSD